MSGTVGSAPRPVSTQQTQATAPTPEAPAANPAPAATPEAPAQAPAAPRLTEEQVQTMRNARSAQEESMRGAWLAKTGVPVSAGAAPAPVQTQATPAGPAAPTTRAVGAQSVPAPVQYDVSTISKTDLDALRKRDPTMAKAIETTRVAYAENIKAGAKVLVTTSPGNGGKPMAVLVPPGFDPAKPARLQTHFHGDSGTIGDVVGDGGLSGSIADMQKKDPQRIVVLPECSNPQFATPGGKTPKYSPVWSNVKDVSRTQADALHAAGATSVAKGGYTISAHSGGGHGVMEAMKADLANDKLNPPGPSRINCDHLELLDCIHYNDGDRGIEKTIAEWGKKHGNEVKSVTGVRGTMGTAADWNSIRDTFGAGKYRGVDVHPGRATIPNPDWKPKSKEPRTIPNPEYLPEGTIPKDRNPKGQPEARWSGVHARARSEFMGQDYVD